ncbi:hypothetical protein N0V88_004243 [Collariella sp. IMI 366227]|nr:hypothetical protein N0V88_004243 [Collariella sp. IMI 366227]
MPPSTNPSTPESSSVTSLVLFPPPSETDPNDPLRWPRWKKHTAFHSICAFTFLTNYGIGGMGPAFYVLSQEFEKSMVQTSDLLLWPILVLGVFNFFWVPLANYFGKRPVFGRWHKWITAILTGINFVTVLLLVPETRYYREEKGSQSGQRGVGISTPSREMVVDDPGCEKAVQNTTEAKEEHSLSPAIAKKTWAEELSLWSGVAPDTNLLKMFVRPLPMFAYPCVIYAFLGYAVSLVLTVSVNILNPFVLQAPPYSWSPMINSLINIPGLIGNIAGSYAGGWLVDVFCDWRTKRNKGVFEPENRLHLCILPLFITGAGCVLFGYGVERTLHWTSLFFGYGMISFALTAVPTATMAYVSDCVLPVNSDALMLVNGSKNIVAFGFLYGIVPWVEKVGYVDCFGTQAGIFVAVIGLGMMFFDPPGGED